jgi:hypothetical protein
MPLAREDLGLVCATALSVFCLSGAGSAAPQPPSDRMAAWATALGVECAYCHVPGDWSSSSRPTFEFAQRMMRMVDGLNAGPLKAVGGITCWTCHRGRTIPARLPRDAWQDVQARHAAEFLAAPDRALTMSVYAASLGVECEYCHESDRAAPGTPAKAMVTRMLEAIDLIPTYFDTARRPTTQCFLCHQGERRPRREPSG